MKPENDPAQTAQKPGWQTSEFWLTLLAQLLGLLMASGLVDDGSQTAKLVGLALSVLTAVGYQANRAIVKASGNKAAALASLAKQIDEQPANPSPTP